MDFNFDVLTIGTATRDVFLQSELFKSFKDEHFNSQSGFPTGEAECFSFGSKIEISIPIFTTGGGATNAATTFARHGFQTASAIAIGKDDAAKAILAEFKREGIKPVITRVKDKGTAYSTILLSTSGERTILVYRGAADLIKSTSLKTIKPKWVYVAPGGIEIKKIKKIVDALKLNGAQFAMNPSGFYLKQGLKTMAPILENLEVVILNREEAALLTGIAYEDAAGIFKKMDEFIKGIVVMTDGPRGVLVADGKNIYKAGIFKEEKLVDRTGAGDAFGSGFLAGLMMHKDIQYAIRLGSANATSVVEKIGAKAGILHKEELEKSLRWQNLEVSTEKLV